MTCPKPALLCLTRHGETDWNQQGILQGWTDVLLNPLGRRQARAMAGSFNHQGFSAVWSSPLMRARETAEIVAPLIRLSFPKFHNGLMERHFGVFQGVPKAELAEFNPVVLQLILKRNPDGYFEGGESMDEFADRVLGALADIGSAHDGQRVLVITHGWVMDVVTRHIKGLPRKAILNMKRKNGESLWIAVHQGIITATHEPENQVQSAA
ncbi:histidine phosphatase family protein [Denitratisoma sp. DHT3]|nr:histidine phosphatase family protein [Denitratisoma sp. DHT3]